MNVIDFFLSAEVYGAAYSRWRPLRIRAEKQLQALQGEDYGDELNSIAIISIIVPTRFYEEGGYKERKLFKRKTREADIRLRIDYNEFINASEEKRLIIYNNHILASIRTLQKKVGMNFDYFRLEEDVKHVLNNSPG